MRIPFLVLITVCLTFCSTNAKADLSFDLVDDLIKSGGTYTGPGLYDFFTANETGGSLGADGVADIRISVMTLGVTADDGNNVAWSTSTDTTTTGLRSTINPSFVSGGGVTSNNSGYRVSQVIQIDFIGGMYVEAQDITDFGWSSGNTSGIAWETAALQYLDANGNSFSALPTLNPYLTHTPVDGQPIGTTGVFVADSTGTVQNVGTDDTDPGSNGANNGVSTSAVGLGIGALTRIGGVRFTHLLEDVRGVNNGDTIFTATINDLNVENFTVTPEPTPGMLFGVALAGFSCSRRRR